MEALFSIFPHRLSATHRHEILLTCHSIRCFYKILQTLLHQPAMRIFINHEPIYKGLYPSSCSCVNKVLWVHCPASCSLQHVLTSIKAEPVKIIRSALLHSMTNVIMAHDPPTTIFDPRIVMPLLQRPFYTPEDTNSPSVS